MRRKPDLEFGVDVVPHRPDIRSQRLLVPDGRDLQSVPAVAALTEPEVPRVVSGGIADEFVVGVEQQYARAGKGLGGEIVYDSAVEHDLCG